MSTWSLEGSNLSFVFFFLRDVEKLKSGHFSTAFPYSHGEGEIAGSKICLEAAKPEKKGISSKKKLRSV